MAYYQAARSCPDHDHCTLIDCIDKTETVVWASHAPDTVHVACRVAEGSYVDVRGRQVEGRDGLCGDCQAQLA